MSESTNIVRVTDYFNQPGVVEVFADTTQSLREAKSYIASVLIAVRSDDRLVQCAPRTIGASALRMCALRLSVDPAINQAYLVAFRNNKKNISECTPIVGYRGYETLAIRTGEYRYLNYFPIHEGDIFEADPISGLHSFKDRAHGTDLKVVGWAGAFELMSGYAKTVYMSLEDIHARAKRYSKSYEYASSLWKTNPQVMERKTIIRELIIKHGVIDTSAQPILREVEPDEYTGELDISIVPEEDGAGATAATERKPPAQEVLELGYAVEEELEEELVNDDLSVDDLSEYDTAIDSISWRGLKHSTAEEALSSLTYGLLGWGAGEYKQILEEYEDNHTLAFMALYNKHGEPFVKDGSK